jgi:hypothetical protein
MVDDRYAPFENLFLYCAAKAYPEYDARFIKIEASNPYEAAARRFLLEADIQLNEYRFCLITDADMMIMREATGVIEQNLEYMLRNGLDCYCNWSSGACMPGVQFVTQNWWEKTWRVRDEFMTQILRRPDVPKGHDEWMLLQIAKKSGLPISGSPITFNHHGIHLGKWRQPVVSSYPILGQEAVWVRQLLNDPEVAWIVSKSGKMVKGMFEAMENQLNESKPGQAK